MRRPRTRPRRVVPPPRLPLRARTAASVADTVARQPPRGPRSRSIRLRRARFGGCVRPGASPSGLVRARFWKSRCRAEVGPSAGFLTTLAQSRWDASVSRRTSLRWGERRGRREHPPGGSRPRSRRVWGPRPRPRTRALGGVPVRVRGESYRHPPIGRRAGDAVRRRRPCRRGGTYTRRGRRGGRAVEEKFGGVTLSPDPDLGAPISFRRRHEAGDSRTRGRAAGGALRAVQRLREC